jgi:hypothetical protein
MFAFPVVAMPTWTTAVIVFGCLATAVLLGRIASARLPAHHLSTEARDTVKLSLGLVATMSALLLGLLVSSAKGAYDAQNRQVDEMAAKIATLDRVFALYGPESARARKELRAIVTNAIARAWPQESGAASDLAPDLRSGDEIYRAVQMLMPVDDSQRDLKSRATSYTIDLAEGRALLVSRALEGASAPLLIVVIGWFVLILFGFSLLAPRAPVATLALTVAAAAVSGAIFLLLEYYEPFEGLIRIPSDPMVASISEIPN